MGREREVFAKNLRKYIDRSFMNQSQIAEELGVSKGTLSDYLSQKAYPRPQRMTRLCEILGVSLYDLTTAEDELAGLNNSNKEVSAIAQNIYENPDARALFMAIQELEPEEIQALKTIVMKLKRN